MIDSDLQALIRREVESQIRSILTFGTTGTPQDGDEEPTEIIENLYGGAPSTRPRPVAHPYGLTSRAPQGTVNVVGQFGEHPGSRHVIGHRDVNRPPMLAGESCLYDANGNKIHLQNAKVDMLFELSAWTAKAKSLTATLTDLLQIDTLNTIINSTDQIVLATKLSFIGSDAASEPLVLGNVLQTALSSFIGIVNDIATEAATMALDLSLHTHTVIAPGVPTTPPDPPFLANFILNNVNFTLSGVDLSMLQSDPVDSGGILSDAHFTEKGE